MHITLSWMYFSFLLMKNVQISLITTQMYWASILSLQSTSEKMKLNSIQGIESVQKYNWVFPKTIAESTNSKFKYPVTAYLKSFYKNKYNLTIQEKQ